MCEKPLAAIFHPPVERKRNMFEPSRKTLDSGESQATLPKALEETIVQYAGSSEYTKEKSREIEKIRSGFVPASKLDIMTTEREQRISLVAPSTVWERLGITSVRQATLLSQVRDLTHDINTGAAQNEECKLRMGLLLNDLYQRLFDPNWDLRQGLEALSFQVALSELFKKTIADTERATGAREQECKAKFAACGVTIHDESLFTDYTSAEQAVKWSWREVARDGEQKLNQIDSWRTRYLASSAPAIEKLKSGAIEAGDKSFEIPVSLPSEKLYAIANSVQEKLDEIRTGKPDWARLGTLLSDITELTHDFQPLAVDALAQVEDKKREIQRCLATALFPKGEVMQLMPELFRTRDISQ
jgi:hypothetical protein